MQELKAKAPKEGNYNKIRIERASTSHNGEYMKTVFFFFGLYVAVVFYIGGMCLGRNKSCAYYITFFLALGCAIALHLALFLVLLDGMWHGERPRTSYTRNVA